jgi:glutathione S-transferase
MDTAGRTCARSSQAAAAAERTLADIAVCPYLAVLRQLGLSLAATPRLAAYHDRVASRPAAVATRPPERLPWARSPWDCLP